jgi:TPR repeat protein
LLFDGASGIGTALQSLAAGLRELSETEVEALAILLPAEAAGSLRRAARALREHPTEPLALVLQPILDELWETYLRQHADAQLRVLVGAAANEADAERLFQEGFRHFSGPLGPATDRASGAQLVQQAAELGHPKAEYLLSQLFAKGDGVTRDLAAARDWQLRAAKHGIIEAQMAVATAYHLGLDVPADPTEAFYWYSLAAAGGHKPAESLRNVAQRKLTPEQIAAVEQRLKKAGPARPAASRDATAK